MSLARLSAVTERVKLGTSILLCRSIPRPSWPSR